MALFGLLPDAKASPATPNGAGFLYGGPTVRDADGNIVPSKAQAQAAQYAGQADFYDTTATNISGRGDAGHAQGQAAVQAAGNASQQAFNALGGVDQARGQQTQSLNDQRQAAQALGAFAQRPQGPSAAAAQLQGGANESFQQQLAMARSGPGASGGAAALRNAAFQQAGIMGQANSQAAQVRAQEDQAYRGQQLQALGLSQEGFGNAANTAQGLRSSDINAGQARAGAALQGGQLNAQTNLQFGQQQDQQTLMNDQAAAGLRGTGLSYDEMGNQVTNSQLNADMNRQALASGQSLQASQYNAGVQNQSNTQDIQTAGEIAGAMMLMSDTREKKDIAHAEGVADAFAALGGTREQRDYETYQGQPDPTARLGVRAGSAGSPFANYDRDRGAAVTRQLASRDAAAVLGYQPPTARFDDVQPDLRGVHNFSYQYRDPNAPGAAPGPQGGPLAQQLEANPDTAHLVRDTPNGKMVDAGRAAMLALPAIGEQQRRLDKLEEAQALGLGANRSPDETTHLSDADEKRFRSWAAKNRISDVDAPDSHYDYRGFYQQNPNARVRFGVDHFPDTFKQHGHPTFSVESQYSSGPYDGGSWNDDTYVPQARPPAGQVDLGALDDAYARERAYR